MMMLARALARSAPARSARIGVPRSVGAFRRINYSNFQYAPRPLRFRRFLTFNLGLVASISFAYYMWWPKHTFPLSVARHLRRGLWAESNKGEEDYQLALKHYLEALDECDRLKMDPLCDEYTGIQLKVGEMYERLDMMDEATFTYNEIATLYLSVLKAPPSSAQGKRIKSIDHRAHLIQKDLRIALKLVELNRLNQLLAKAILITHLLIAQDEVNRKLGVPAGSLTDASLIADGERTLVLSLDAGTEPEIVLQTNPEAWEPFTNEFFNAMDLLSAICTFFGDIKAASSIRVAMTSKMLMAGVSPERLLLSQCNTASLLYFQAEQLQAEEQMLRRKFATAAGVDYAKVKAIHDPLQPVDVGEDEAGAIRVKIVDAVLDADKDAYERVVGNKQRLLQMTIATYESVIAGLKKLPQEVQRDNTYIGEIVALATYGLGVVYLHLSDYDRAERLLREARVRSKGCGYDLLIEEVERELGKLFNEKKTLKAKDTGIEMDIHMKKRSEERGARDTSPKQL